MAKTNRLGKGLNVYFEENSTDLGSPVSVRLSEIEPNRDQPRKDFDPEALAELAESIARYGLIQPLLVRPMGDGYQLVAGERRWRASKMCGMVEVPVIIKELSDSETAEIALVENLQREDLNPIEEAMGYRSLMDDYGLTQDEVSERVGRSRSAVANSVRLLGLPEEITLMVRTGKISAGHGRALLAFNDKDEMAKAAKIASFGATVRDIEKMAKRANEKAMGKEKNTVNVNRDPYFDEVALALSEALGRRVKVTKEKGKGVLSIEFYSNDELKDMANKLGEM
ncbi:MAG: ParB/RepB/Spo0J family partition protein [Clostridia bacterium]|nr:ParB/RepB/Spo0J family partition protein [Clostridia bacterium]